MNVVYLVQNFIIQLYFDTIDILLQLLLCCCPDDGTGDEPALSNKGQCQLRRGQAMLLRKLAVFIDRLIHVDLVITPGECNTEWRQISSTAHQQSVCLQQT